MSNRCFAGGCGCLDVPKGGGCLGTRLQETDLNCALIGIYAPINFVFLHTHTHPYSSLCAHTARPEGSQFAYPVRLVINGGTTPNSNEGTVEIRYNERGELQYL